MSDHPDHTDEPQVVQSPGRAVQPTAPGVLTNMEAPDADAISLHTGDLVGGRFLVVRYLGASGGGISYLCEDTAEGGEVVIKVLSMPPPDQVRFGQMAEQVRTASAISHRNLTKIIGMGRLESGKAFVAMEFVKGSTLSSIIARRREAGTSLSVRDTFTVLAHVCEALSEVHKSMIHGVLTPYNIYIDTHGVVRIGNLAFGRIAASYMLEQGEGPFADSIYVAPEVADAPDLMSDAADIFSLGMTAAEMLSPRGLHADRDEAKAEAIMMLSSYPSSLSRLISTAIGEDLAARPRSARAFRDAFEKAARGMGVELTGAPPEGSLMVESAIQEGGEEEDLFDLPDFGAGLDMSSDPEHERFLVSKGGLDYGPFTEEKVLAQLYADEIDEFTSVLDRLTQDRVPLGEMDRFKAKVQEYIPKREERRRLEAEARAALERKVKKGGVGLLVAGIIGGLVLIGLQIAYYVTRPDPVAFPVKEAFAELSEKYKFLPPPKEFTAVAVDKKLLENIFNPQASEEEIKKALKKRRKGRRKGPKSAGGGGGDDGKTFEITMDGTGSEYTLTDEDVNDVILTSFGGLRSCMLAELKRNSGFRGVTVQFFIRPTGTTGGVKIKESKYSGSPVGDCLTARFRSMKFPEHGGFNRGVVYPLMVQ